MPRSKVIKTWPINLNDSDTDDDVPLAARRSTRRKRKRPSSSSATQTSINITPELTRPPRVRRSRRMNDSPVEIIDLCDSPFNHSDLVTPINDTAPVDQLVTNAIPTVIDESVIVVEPTIENHLDDVWQDYRETLGMTENEGLNQTTIDYYSILDNESPIDYFEYGREPEVIQPPMEKLEEQLTKKSDVVSPVKHNTSNGGIECPICMESLRSKSIYSTYCGHIFCKGCIFTVFGKKKSIVCPQCRKLLKRSDIHPIFLKF